MTTLLCVNPLSRSGDISDALLAERLQALGPVETHRLTEDGDLDARAAALRGRLARIVVGGGDGTLNRTLPTVLEAGVPLGVIPLGTGNDFARSLAIPLDAEQALEVIAAGHRVRVDVGEANGRPFLNAVGIGLGPTLTRRLDREEKVRLGVFAYLTSLIEVIGQRRQQHADLVLDGRRRRVRYMQITIANGPHYGGGMTVGEDVRLDDELLHVLCLKPQTPLELLGKLATMRWGLRHGERDDKLELYAAAAVEVATRSPVDVTLDGELLDTTPLACRCLPKRLEVFAPPDTPVAQTAAT